MKLSVVSTLYRSAPYIREFYSRITATIRPITDDYEIIFVNDGSPDDSLEIATTLLEADPKVRVIDLSRNFGHHKAMMTGLAHVTGDLILLIDVDLEEKPELLTEFWARYQEDVGDVVYGVQDIRRGSWFRRMTGNAFFAIFNLLSSTPIPRNVTTVRLMSRRYVDALIQHTERVFIIAGLWELTGFRQFPVTIKKKYKGKTTYDIARRLSFLLFSLTAFSNRPLIFISYLGLFLMMPSGLLILYILIQRLFLHVGVDGWTSLIVSVWFLGGLNIFVLGIIAIYLSVIFTETKARPYTLIRHIYQRNIPEDENQAEVPVSKSIAYSQSNAQ